MTVGTVPTIDRVSDEVLRYLGTLTGSNRAYAFHLRGSKLSNTHEWTDKQTKPFVDRLSDLTVNDLPYFVTNLRRGNPIIMSSPEDLRRAEANLEYEEILNEGIDKLVMVPVYGVEKPKKKKISNTNINTINATGTRKARSSLKNEDELEKGVVTGFIGLDFCSSATPDLDVSKFVSTLSHFGRFLNSLQTLCELSFGTSPIRVEREALSARAAKAGEFYRATMIPKLIQELQSNKELFSQFAAHVMQCVPCPTIQPAVASSSPLAYQPSFVEEINPALESASACFADRRCAPLTADTWQTHDIDKRDLKLLHCQLLSAVDGDTTAPSSPLPFFGKAQQETPTVHQGRYRYHNGTLLALKHKPSSTTLPSVPLDAAVRDSPVLHNVVKVLLERVWDSDLGSDVHVDVRLYKNHRDAVAANEPAAGHHVAVVGVYQPTTSTAASTIPTTIGQPFADTFSGVTFDNDQFTTLASAVAAAGLTPSASSSSATTSGVGDGDGYLLEVKCRLPIDPVPLPAQVEDEEAGSPSSSSADGFTPRTPSHLPHHAILVDPSLSINQQPDDDAAVEATCAERLATILRLAYCIVSFAVMFVLVRVWGQMMPSHSYFYSVSWGCGFVPVFGVLLAYKRLVKKTTPAMLDAPWPMIKQAAFIGFTYAVNYWGVSTSAPHVAGPAQVIASQFPIVVATILTAVIFKRKYNIIAWLGVALTLAGTLTQGLSGNNSGHAPIGWFIVFAVGNLPTAIWAVVFEGFFKAKGPDGKQATLELRMMWVNVFIVLWLLVFIPFFGLLHQPSFENFWPNFTTAAECVFTGAGGYPEDNCHAAGWILAVTIPIAAMQAHSQVLLSRGNTGIFATLCLTTAPFLADGIFPVRAIMGQYTDAVNKWDGLAAALCCVGVIAFALGESRRKKNLQAEVDGARFIQWFVSTRVPKPLRGLFGDGSDEAENDDSKTLPFLVEEHDERTSLAAARH